MRDENWDNPFYRNQPKPGKYFENTPTFETAYELGADAMLEALRQQAKAFGEHHNKGVTRLLSSHSAGSFVFIPDD